MELKNGGKVETFSDGTQAAEFQFDFEGKSLQTNVDENGDLWIEGYASDFGLDRQEEAFESGAFQRGLKSFLERNPIMLYHHQYDKALGQFVDARVDENGLWVRGRVDRPAQGSWAEDVFNKIARGTIKAFSVGGIFKRRMTPHGPRIYDVDLGEISVTPFPVNPRTTFAVVAKKAFENAPLEGKAEIEGEEKPEPVVEVEQPTLEQPCSECAARAAEAAAKDEKPEDEKPEDEKPEDEKPEDEDIPEEAMESIAWALDPEAKDTESMQLDALAEALDGVFDKIETKLDKPVEAEEAEAVAAAEVDAEGKAVTTSGRSLPTLERSLKKNWVEKVGGFGTDNWIYRTAKHLVYEKGFAIGHAIATAINAAKKACATGDLNWPGVQHVNPASRAEACAAVAKWEAMKAKS